MAALSNKASARSAKASARRGFLNESNRLAAAERREQEHRAAIEAARVAEAELVALEATFPPLPGERFEDEANQRATDALLEKLQAHHRPQESHNGV